MKGPILILLCVSVTSWVAMSAESSDCSRVMSRKVRDFLEDNMKDVMEKYTFPDECPLNPSKDLYRKQENMKKQFSQEWKCLFCGKKFVSENYLDRHMDNKHPELLYQGNDTICLSDYCKIFGCKRKDIYNSYDVQKLNKKAMDFDRCTPEKATALRTQCTSISTKCFPETSTEAKIFQQLVCEPIACVHGVFQGGIKGEPLTSTSILFILKLFGIFVILLVAGFHACIAEIPVIRMISNLVYTPKPSSSSSSTSSHTAALRNDRSTNIFADYRRRHAQSSSGNTNSSSSGGNNGESKHWFVATILDAFRTVFKSRKE